LAATRAALAGSALLIFRAQGGLVVPRALLSGAALERFVATGQVTVPEAVLFGTDAQAIFDLVVLEAGRRLATALLAGRLGTASLDASRQSVYDLEGSF
jgi:hypothetical protein